MRILLISSEPLYPGDTHSSCFELIQARALEAAGHQVAVLAVYQLCSSQIVRAILRKVTWTSGRNAMAQRFTLPHLLALLLSSLRQSPQAQRHVIEGIRVYEGIVLARKMPQGVGARSRLWHEAGKLADAQYLEDFGKPPDVYHGHSRFLSGAELAGALALRRRRPYLVTEHSSVLLRGTWCEEERQALREVYLSAAKVLAVSQAMANAARSVTRIEKALAVLPNPLDELFLSQESSDKEERFTFLSVGLLDQNKNQILVLRSLAKISESCQLWIVGDGPERDALERSAGELRLGDRVHFLGHQSRPAVKALMSRAHALVIASKMETFGVVAIEALACGIPVITTPCGGPEEIVDQDTGVVTDFCETKMADALSAVLERYQSYRPDLLRKRAMERYSPARFARDLTVYYEAALAGEGSGPAC